MKLLTFVEMDEIAEYAKLEDAAINEAKKRLAYEVTKIVHGEDIANQVKKQTEDIFENQGRSEDMNSTEISSADVASGNLQLAEVLISAGLMKSKGEAKRMISQKGIYLNDEVVEDQFYTLKESDFTNNEAIIRKGKKVHHRLTLV